MDVVFRCDANEEIGYGHVMRSMALAQYVQSRGDTVRFVLKKPPSFVKGCLEASAIEWANIDPSGPKEDYRSTREAVNEFNTDWIVIDGYHFDTEYQSLWKKTGTNVAYLDDHAHLNQYNVNLLINQNLHANRNVYKNKVNDNTKMLMGPDYILLRTEFLDCVDWKRETFSRPDRLLVTIGGTDTRNLVPDILGWLQGGFDRNFETHIITADADCVAGVKNDPRFVLRTDVDNMAVEMKHADLAITASGTTVWEMCFMELPMLTVVTANNQQDIANHLEQNGVSLNLGWYTDLTKDDVVDTTLKVLRDPEKRRTMSSQGRYIVDGKGVKRVYRHMKSVVKK
ncbi:MAG: UDP-2,4-diacetamido-2,4,6-trideoxy-beta-L-altropyranose hydrolase [bacterium]